MKKLIFSALALFASLAQATSGHTFYHYFTYLHFEGRYFGQSVSAVYAHIGVESTERGYGSPGSRWDDVKHVEMSARNGHFFAKVGLEAEAHTHYFRSVEGPIVQYWVYLADGSLVITDPVRVPQRRLEFLNVYSIEDLRANPAYRAYESETYSPREDDTSTHADVLSGGYAS